MPEKVLDTKDIADAARQCSEAGLPILTTGSEVSAAACVVVSHALPLPAGRRRVTFGHAVIDGIGRFATSASTLMWSLRPPRLYTSATASRRRVYSTLTLLAQKAQRFLARRQHPDPGTARARRARCSGRVP